MHATSKVYAPDMIIVSAELIGFAKREDAKETCTHKGCGYDQGQLACPKCKSTSHVWKEVIPSSNWSSDENHWVSMFPKTFHEQRAYCCTQCDTLIETKIVEEDGKKKLKRTRAVYEGGTGPVKCKHTSKFTLLSEGELCNPETKTNHAVLQTRTFIAEIRDIRRTLVIINIEDGTCEPGLWAHNECTNIIFKNGDLDTSKIVNLHQMIDNMFS